MLSDRDIVAAQEAGQITLDPFRRDCVQPASVDVHLSPQVRIFQALGILDTADIRPGHTSWERIGKSGYLLRPRDFILGATVEVVGCGARMAARIEGRSSLGRLGLVVHSTAGFIDPGFCGTVTLEIANIGNRPILLHPNMSIAQVCFFRISSTPTSTYDKVGNYQDQTGGPVESRYRLTT